MEQTNQTRETRIAEITLLQQQLQVQHNKSQVHATQQASQRLPNHQTRMWDNYCPGCFVLTSLFQDSQQWLGRLIPDKQSLNDQLKQVQQNSLHRESHTYYLFFTLTMSTPVTNESDLMSCCVFRGQSVVPAESCRAEGDEQTAAQRAAGRRGERDEGQAAGNRRVQHPAEGKHK